MSIQPQGENLRRAVKWIGEERKYTPDQSSAALLQAVCLKFDLTPVEAEYLARLLKENPNCPG